MAVSEGELRRMNWGEQTNKSSVFSDAESRMYLVRARAPGRGGGNRKGHEPMTDVNEKMMKPTILHAN